MSNPNWGKCPCCRHSKTHFINIHSDLLFRMFSTLGEFKRNTQFCTDCIDWAKSQQNRRYQQDTVRNYSPISEPGGMGRKTPDPFVELAEEHEQNVPMASHSLDIPMASQSEAILHDVQMASQPHDVPMAPSNANMVRPCSNVGSRLANPNGSPVHLGLSPYILQEADEAEQFLADNAPLFIGPMPGPLLDNADLLDLDDGQVKPHESMDEPE